MESSPSDSDLDLLKQSAASDAAAFHQLVDRHADRLFGLAVSLLPNRADAEDVLQETLAGAYRGLVRFEQRASVKTWLTRILILQIAKWRRERKNKRTEPIDPQAASAVDHEASANSRMDVQAAMAKLSPEHQEVMVLREFEQLSYEEIAGALGVPRGTVESRLFRARAELRVKLKAYR